MSTSEAIWVSNKNLVISVLTAFSIQGAYQTELEACFNLPVTGVESSLGQRLPFAQTRFCGVINKSLKNAWGA